MSADSPFEKPLEDDGITLGPEDALRREIEKSKSLKVEKLQLRDEVEKLRTQTASLCEENKSLKYKIEQLEKQTPTLPLDIHSQKKSSRPVISPGWSFFLLIFNLGAIGVLLILLLQR